MIVHAGKNMSIYKSSLHPSSPLEDEGWWPLLHSSSNALTHTRYAFSVLLQVCSAPTQDLRRTAIHQAVELGIPSGILAEEAILNGQPETLKMIKEELGETWGNWVRKMPPVSVEIIRDSEGLDGYLQSIDRSPGVIEWMIRHKGFEHSETCLEAALKDPKDSVDPNFVLNLNPTIQTHAVLVEKEATALAVAVSHQNLPAIKVLLKDSRVLACQQALDEALFIIGGQFLLSNSFFENKGWDGVVLDLLKAGANPNRSFECCFPKRKSAEVDDWTWQVCAGERLVEQCLSVDKTKKSFLSKEIWSHLKEVVEPNTWPSPTGPVKDFLATTIVDLGRTGKVFNKEALSCLAKAPRSFSHEHFISSVLMTLIDDTYAELAEKKEYLLNQSNSIGKPIQRTSDEIWNLVLREVKNSSPHLFGWAKEFTGESLSFPEIIEKITIENVDQIMKFDFSEILDSKELKLWNSLQQEYKKVLVDGKSQTPSIQAERVGLFVIAAHEGPAPKPKSLRL